MRFSTSIAILLTAVTGAVAESHTVRFNNKCGSGTPTLIQGGKVLSTGKQYTSNGPLSAAIAYLQTGGCQFNGEGCTLVELTLKNPTSPGGGSVADISLIPPHKFSKSSGFKFYNGCDGAGTECRDASCPKAFRKTDDYFAQVPCQVNDVDLQIDFCA